MSQYKIIDENVEQPYDSVIQKTGLTSEFTINQLMDHLDFSSKKMKEAETQVEINDKQNELIEETIPVLKDIPEEQWQMATTYFVRKQQRLEYEQLIETCKETIAKYKKTLEDIKNEFGIDIPEQYVQKENI